MSETINDQSLVPGTQELHDAVRLKIQSDGYDRDYAVHEKTDSEYRNQHRDSKAGVSIGNGSLTTYVKGAGDKQFSIDTYAASTVDTPIGLRQRDVSPGTIADPELVISNNELFNPVVSISKPRGGMQPTVRYLTGERAKRGAEIVNGRAARLIGERATGLARIKIERLQNGIDKVEANKG